MLRLCHELINMIICSSFVVGFNDVATVLVVIAMCHCSHCERERTRAGMEELVICATALGSMQHVL